MTSSAGVRRGERFDREQVVADPEHRRVVADLLADSGFPDVTGTDEPLPELGPTLLTVPGRASRGVPDLPHVDLLGAEPGDDAPDLAFLTDDVDVPAVRRADGRVVLGPTRRVAFPHGSARWHGTSFADADVSGPIARVAQEEGATAWQALSRIGSRRHGDGHDVHAHRP